MPRIPDEYRGKEKRVLWSGRCKHHGFVNDPLFNDNNHYLAEVVGTSERGGYLNSQWKMSQYRATRRKLFKNYWICYGWVTGYYEFPVWFLRWGKTLPVNEAGIGIEKSIIINPFNLTAISITTKYRDVVENEDPHSHTYGEWLKSNVSNVWRRYVRKRKNSKESVG